ncbi:MAG: DUF5715 family protein [Terracidiphilus sp.]
MSRIAIIVLVLAALTVISANGSPTRPAKTHKTVPAKTTSRNAHTKAHHATPQEVGQAAGLKIRRELARHPVAVQATRHTVIAQASRPRQTVGTNRVAETSRTAVAKMQPKGVEDSGKRTEIAFAEVAPPDPPMEASAREVEAPAAKGEIPAEEAEAPTEETQAPSADVPAPVEDVKVPARKAGMVATSLHLRRGALPPPLLGSHASLERQNEKTEADGLERIEDEEDLADRIAHKLLVPVPASVALTVNGNLPVNHRYCRPWTARFLSDLARSHAAQFHRPLEVSSAVRTVEYQKHLMGINGNAAAAEGDVVSPHLTGATVDIAKGLLSREEVGWMRTRLLALEEAGKIDVEEEFQQSCFHITVYKSYAPPAPAVTRKPRRRRQTVPTETIAQGL